jgi:hypothetical protein
MRRRLAARTTLAGAFVVASVSASAAAANAAVIREPAPSVVVVANAPMTVVASGFVPGSLVYVEQCDGVPSTAKGWDVTLDCDNGAAPPPAVADTQGQATFPADKPNRAFRAFQGQSPSSLFNCVAPGAARPANALQTYTNCQLRVSSSNTSVTDDQVLQPIVLSGRSVPLTLATTSTTAAPARGPKATSKPRGAAPAPAARTKPGHGTTPSTVSGGGARARSLPERTAEVASPAPTGAPASSSNGAGALALSDGAVAAGYALVAIGLLIAVVSAFFASRRRARSAVPSVTGIETPGERT